jgi:hypothetical protein
MVGQRNLTAPAAHHKAAIPTLNEASSAPSIEEKDYLLLSGESLTDTLAQRATENAAIARSELPTHVHDLYGGEARA